MHSIKLRVDPNITSTDSQVDPDEMLDRHTPPKEMSGEGTTVVVQDTGLDPDHPRIEENVGNVEYHDFTGSGEGDAVGHGTMVTDLATRYASSADVIVNRVFGTSGSTGFEPIGQSFEWVLDNADRIDALVMSWGASEKSSAIDNMVNEIARAGVVPFAAAGNSGGAPGSPATAKYAVSVGALQEGGDRMTNFSSWDQDKDADPGLPGVPDVCAIGKNVVGARADGTSMGHIIDENNVVASGTSFSAPFTAGVGLDLIRRGGQSTKELLIRLEQSATDIPGTTRDGLGRVNWAGAIESDGGIEEPETTDATVWSLPWGKEDFVHVNADTLDDGEYVVDLAAFEDAFTANADE